LLAALVLTLSQSSIIGLLAGLTALAALRWSPKWILGGTAVILVAVSSAVIALPKETINVGSLRSLNTQSSGRAGLVSGGVELFASRPATGWGSGSFSTAYRSERGSGSAAAVTASHTTPVTAAAEQGVIGLAVYLLVVAAAFLAALRRARMSTARAAVTAGLVAMVVHSLTYAAFFEDPASWTLFALAASLPLPSTREERRSARESKRAVGPDNDRPAAAPA
jgi:O-antigen ligase